MNVDHRQPAKTKQPTDGRSFPFSELINREHARLDRATHTNAGTHQRPSIALPGRADEPWVNFTDRDLLGVALSGGGIRSATFNLGLLQALDRKHLLAETDYLSTVSGGGYVGGFWTAWRVRPEAALDDDRPFPTQTEADRNSGIPETREQPEIRHLREFGRFLMPRLGFSIWKLGPESSPSSAACCRR